MAATLRSLAAQVDALASGASESPGRAKERDLGLFVGLPFVEKTREELAELYPHPVGGASADVPAVARLDATEALLRTWHHYHPGEEARRDTSARLQYVPPSTETVPAGMTDVLRGRRPLSAERRGELERDLAARWEENPAASLRLTLDAWCPGCRRELEDDLEVADAEHRCSRGSPR